MLHGLLLPFIRVAVLGAAITPPGGGSFYLKPEGLNIRRNLQSENAHRPADHHSSKWGSRVHCSGLHMGFGGSPLSTTTAVTTMQKTAVQEMYLSSSSLRDEPYPQDLNRVKICHMKFSGQKSKCSREA